MTVWIPDPRQYTEARRLRDDGMTLDNIGRAIGVTTARVRTLIRYADFEANHDAKWLRGLSTQAVNALWDRGCRTPHEVAAVLPTLPRMGGVGTKTVAEIRAWLVRFDIPDAAPLDVLGVSLQRAAMLEALPPSPDWMEGLGTHARRCLDDLGLHTMQATAEKFPDLALSALPPNYGPVTRQEIIAWLAER